MSAMVSGGGRLYYIMDEGSRVSIQLSLYQAAINMDEGARWKYTQNRGKT